MRYPFLAAEMNDGERSLFIADLPYGERLSELRSKAQQFVKAHWQRCYLALDRQRCLYYDLDGNPHVSVLPPERKWFSSVPVYDWSEVPI